MPQWQLMGRGTRASADRDGINKQKGEKGRRVLIKDYNAKLFGSDWRRLIYYNDTQILLNTYIETFHQQPKENVQNHQIMITIPRTIKLSKPTQIITHCSNYYNKLLDYPIHHLHPNTATIVIYHAKSQRQHSRQRLSLSRRTHAPLPPRPTIAHPPPPQLPPPRHRHLQHLRPRPHSSRRTLHMGHHCKTDRPAAHPPLQGRAKSKVRVVIASIARSHALFETNAGLFGFGTNQNKELGFDKDKYVAQPHLINEGKVDHFACGFRQSYYIKGGALLGCGQTRKYELGVSEKQPQKWRTICDSLEHFGSVVADMVCGKRFLLILCQDGQVWALGLNQHNVFNKKEVTHTIVPIPVYSGIKQVSCGWAHVVLLLDNGRVLTFGRNNLGQLGRKETQAVQFVLGAEQMIEKVRSGTQFSFAITNTGRLFGWGWNQHQNILPENTWSFPTPVEIPLAGPCEDLWTMPATTLVKYSPP